MLYDRVTGFVLQELIQNTGLHSYYKGYTVQDQKPVLLKILSSGASSENIRSMQAELELTQALNSERFLTPLRYDSFQGSPALVYADNGALPLWKYVKVFNDATDQKIRLAISLVHAINELHATKNIHSAIRPQHIFIHPSDRTLFLTGLDWCIPFPSTPSITPKPPLYHEQLPYMSPEQSGRLEQTIDYRSDFYSLGIVWFEWFTGRLPFEAADLTEWVYAHVARQPPAPHIIAKTVPEMISRIILKLLSKSADQRYHSSLGLEKDLLLCLQRGSESDSSYIELGKYDRAPSIYFPQKLYGRDQELEQLIGMCEEVSAGHKRFTLISGYSGIGKTSIIYELYNRMPSISIAMGKCSKSRATMPYEPILQAINRMLQQILLDRPERVEQLKPLITHELGPNADMLTPILPEIEPFLSDYPVDVPALSTNQEELTFQTLLMLLRAICREHLPLVLVIDNLHLADKESIQLLKAVLQDDKIQYMHIIGTYRDHELTDQHPLRQWRHSLLEEFELFEEIRLPALDQFAIHQLVQDSLPGQVPISRSLVKEIFHKSQGNPNYAKQFLQLLYKNGLLTFDDRSSSWSYDLLKIQSERSTEEVADLIIHRFQYLPKRLQRFLTLAACIGERFDWQTIKRVSEDTDPEILVREAIKEGIIYQINLLSVQYDNSRLQFEFIHHKVYKTLYDLVDSKYKQSIHYRIGQHLYDCFQDQDLDDKLFDVVHHLNLSADLQIRVQDRLRLVELNSRAGHKAKAAFAVDAALLYYETGLKLLTTLNDKPKSIWFTLVLNSAECHAINKQHQKALHIYHLLLDENLSLMERAEVYRQMIILYCNRYEYVEAISTGYRALKLFNLELPENFGRQHRWKEQIMINWYHRRNRTKTIMELPELTKPMLIRKMELMLQMVMPAFHVNLELASFLVLNLYRLTLRHGQTELTSAVLAHYGMLASAGLLSYDRGFQLGNLSIRHADRSQHIDWRSQSYFLFAGFIHHWKRPISETIEYFKQGLDYSIEAGKPQLSSLSCSLMTMAQLIQGTQLAAIHNEVEEYLQRPSLKKDEGSKRMYSFLKIWIDVLRGNLALDSERAKTFFHLYEEYSSNKDTAALMQVYPTWLIQVLVLFGREEEAVKLGMVTDKAITGKLLYMNHPEFYLYFGLALAKHYRQSKAGDQRKYWMYLRRIWRMFKSWSKECPENYEHKCLMIGAEMARIRGNDTMAMTDYEKAIQQARQHHFMNCSAIFGEWTGVYYLEKGMNKIAKSYLQEAYYDYMNWGAYGKASMLQRQYATLFQSAFQGEKRLVHVTDGQTEQVYHVLSKAIDYSTMVEVLQTISGEIVFDKLLEKLIRLLMENAGAQRGLLIFEKEGQLCVEAEGEVGGHFSVLKATMLEDVSECSHSIIQYCVRTQKPVVLHDASRDMMFRNDAYIQQNQVKSLLCMPILKQGKPIGILYMENNAAIGTFTPIRLEVLSLLSSQAAISIENARLYTEMEAKVRERTLELEKANQRLKSRNEDLLRMETSRRHLLSNISHDLRTPMTLIQGYVEGILEGVIADEAQKTKYLTMIYNKVIALNHLITDLFQLTTLEARRIPFTIQKITLANYMKHLKERFELDVQNASLNFILTISQELSLLPAAISIDLDRMDQVFYNLIFNAIRYTQPGGTIHIHLDRLNENRLLIKVQDNGSGIAEEDLAFIFDRFYKGNKSRSGKTEGSGLGLAICKEIVESHGGSIWVESKPNEGSAFSFMLPLLLENKLHIEK